MVYLRLAIKDLKRVIGMSILVILFFCGIFLTVMSLVSAVEVKMKAYQDIRPYLKGNGVILFPFELAKGVDEGGTLLRDEKEIQEYLSGVKNVMCMETIWEPVIAGFSQDVNVYCYGSEMTECLNPMMEEGHWFQKEDLHSEMLCAVITDNSKGKLHAGDVVTIRSKMDREVEVEALVIGVLKDREQILYADPLVSTGGDYRDCYYVISNSSESALTVFLSDTQILNGETDGRFGFLNYRVNPNQGFQKQMRGFTIITFDENMSQDEVSAELSKLKGMSYILHQYDLKTFRKNSIRYVLEDLKTWSPLFFCVILFVLITVISVNTIMVKKQLGNYVIYYMCGLSWRDCGKISLVASLIECAVSVIFTGIIFAIFKLTEISVLSVLQIGLFQVLAVLLMMLLFLSLSHSVPGWLVRRTSAKEVMAENKI